MPIIPSDVSTQFSDVTTNNSSTTKHGYLKKLSNVSTEFMNGQGNWATPSGGGVAPHIGRVTGRYYIPWGAVLSSTVAMVANRLYAAPFVIASTVTATKIGIEVTTPGAGGTLIRLGIYSNGTGIPGALLLDAGTVTADSGAVKEITISQQLTAGWYWLAAVTDGTPTCRAAGSDANQRQSLYGTPGTTGGTSELYVAHTFGALPNPFGTPTYDTGTTMSLLWTRD